MSLKNISGASKSSEFLYWPQYVSMSVGKRVFSKTSHQIFLKLFMKLGCLKGKNLIIAFMIMLKPYI